MRNATTNLILPTIKLKQLFSLFLGVLVVTFINIIDNNTLGSSAALGTESFSTQDTSSQKGMLIILSSPSGGGKTSVARKLREQDSKLTLSVSATTRQPRAGEQDGIDYFFLSREDFKTAIEENQFAIYREIHGNFYGTYKSTIEKRISETHQDLLFNVNWTGRQKLTVLYPQDTISIFILPPSAEALRIRLDARGDKQDSIETRLSAAPQEISHWAEYDYVIINENFDETTTLISNTIKAERLKRSGHLPSDTTSHLVPTKLLSREALEDLEKLVAGLCEVIEGQ